MDTHKLSAKEIQEYEEKFKAESEKMISLFSKKIENDLILDRYILFHPIPENQKESLILQIIEKYEIENELANATNMARIYKQILDGQK